MDNNINIDGDVDIKFDAQLATARQVLVKYTNALQSLRLLAEQKYNVRPYHFDKYLLFKYFQESNVVVDKDSGTSQLAQPLIASLLKIELLKHIRNRRRQIIYWFSYFLVASILFFVYRQDGMIQDRNLVYPSMRIWRRLTLPLIQRFPQLTELYDESCLMGNPFFQVEDLNCEPCAYVDSVLELLEDSNRESEGGSSSGANHKILNEFVPFVFKINQSSIHLHDFYSIYSNNQDIFRRDAHRVQSTNRDVTNLEELFYQFNSSSDQARVRHSNIPMHSLWRCNRMLPARLLRPLFASSRPFSRLPTTGIALERFVAFDTSNAPTYTLPDTECANVYVQQLQGTRFIILRPTSECRHRCRTLSMRLPQSSVLNYNWWYWKPISAPDPAAETASISLIGSYC